MRFPTPALDIWHRRTEPRRYDAIASAAAWEAAALDAELAGDHRRAKDYFNRADEIIYENGAAIAEMAAWYRRQAFDAAKRLPKPRPAISTLTIAEWPTAKRGVWT